MGAKRIRLKPLYTERERLYIDINSYAGFIYYLQDNGYYTLVGLAGSSVVGFKAYDDTHKTKNRKE